MAVEDVTAKVDEKTKGMVRSNPMMPVREHRMWLTTIADNIRRGIVAM